MQTKDQLRRYFRGLREAISARQVHEKSLAIERRVLQLPPVVECETFFVYVSVGKEVHTRELIEGLIVKGKVVTVPRVVGPGRMEAHRIEGLAGLKTGRYDIPEPAEANHHAGRVDVCIAPGVAFTPDGRRLGAGGGYYDRYLVRHPAGTAIALAYDFQVTEQLPVTERDRAVDWIVTESRVIECGAR